MRGSGYVTYDLVQRGIDPILSATDEISLHFRTRKPEGMLFYTGKKKRAKTMFYERERGRNNSISL